MAQSIPYLNPGPRQNGKIDFYRHQVPGSPSVLRAAGDGNEMADPVDSARR